MKNFHIKNSVITGLALILSGICSIGFSQKKSDASVQKGGIKLNISTRQISMSNIFQTRNCSGYGRQWTIDACQYIYESWMRGESAGKQGENLNLESG